jgi:hypothetical protein
MVFAATQIIASSLVSRAHQGAAGSLIGTLLTYGLSTGLGFAGTVEKYSNRVGSDPLRGYRAAGWLGVGMAVGALVLGTVFVRMPKNDKEGWGEEEVEQTEKMDVSVG